MYVCALVCIYYGASVTCGLDARLAAGSYQLVVDSIPHQGGIDTPTNNSNQTNIGIMAKSPSKLKAGGIILNTLFT